MSEYSILLEIKDYHVNKLCNKVISQLKNLKGDNLLSPDDHGLKNVWEEICIQKQVEESVFWNAYDETVEQIIEFIFKETDKEILKLLSIMDDEEFEQIEENDFSYTKYIYLLDSAIKPVKEAVYNQAGLYSKKNIQHYLDN